MNKEKEKEREILLERFFNDDRRLYKLGKATSITWFDKFNDKFSKDEFAFFASKEKIKAIEQFVGQELDDERFISALNKIGPPEYMSIDCFEGKYYYFDNAKKSFRLDDRSEKIFDQVKQALKDTGKRGFYFLKAIIDLHKENKWDKAYGGATWIDILAKVRELGGVYPAPRDISMLKSYRVYFKTGSRRYPTHTIPEEMMITIEKALNYTKEG